MTMLSVAASYARAQLGTRTIVLMPVAIALDIAAGSAVQQGLKIPIYLDSIGTILVGILAGPLAGALTGAAADLIWGYVLPPPLGTPTAGPFAITAAVIGLLAGVLSRLGFYSSRPRWRGQDLVKAAGVLALALAVVFYTYQRAYIDPQVFKTNTGYDAGVFQLSRVIFGVLLLVVAVLLALGLYVRRDLGAIYALSAGMLIGVVAAVVSAPVAAFVFGGVTGSGFDLLVAGFRAGGASLFQATLQQGLLSDPLDKMLTSLLAFLIVSGLPRRLAAAYPDGPRFSGSG